MRTTSVERNFPATERAGTGAREGPGRRRANSHPAITARRIGSPPSGGLFDPACNSAHRARDRPTTPPSATRGWNELHALSVDMLLDCGRSGPHPVATLAAPLMLSGWNGARPAGTRLEPPESGAGSRHRVDAGWSNSSGGSEGVLLGAIAPGRPPPWGEMQALAGQGGRACGWSTSAASSHRLLALAAGSWRLRSSTCPTAVAPPRRPQDVAREVRQSSAKRKATAAEGPDPQPQPRIARQRMMAAVPKATSIVTNDALRRRPRNTARGDARARVVARAPGSSRSGNPADGMEHDVPVSKAALARGSSSTRRSGPRSRPRLRLVAQVLA